MLDAPRRHVRGGRGPDRHRAPHHRGRGRVRAEGRGRRLGAGEPALARATSTCARSPQRQRRRRPPLRGRLHESTTRRRGRRREHPSTRSEPRLVDRCRERRRCVTDSSSSTSRPGCTSHDVVAKLRKAYGQRTVGHAGTLDPDATGVLLVGLGSRHAPAALPAGDGQGVPRVGSCSASPPARSTPRARCSSSDRCRSPRDDVERALPRVRRRHRADAADGVGGEGRRPAPARAGARGRGGRARAAARAHRPVRRRGFEPGPYPEADVVVECSSGTYVRSLAADLGTALGGCAHLGVAAPPARRRRSPSTRRARSTTIEADPRRGGAAARPTRCATSSGVDVDAEQARAVAHGVAFARRRCSAVRRARPVRGRRRPTARCSRSTSGAARRVKPAVVLAPECGVVSASS